MANEFTRRRFLRSAGAAGATLSWAAKSYSQIAGANDRIRMAFIGAGGMGNSHLDAYNGLREKNNLEAVAVADCWQRRADAGAKKVSAEKAFGDYRHLLELPNIDAAAKRLASHAVGGNICPFHRGIRSNHRRGD